MNYTSLLGLGLLLGIVGIGLYSQMSTPEVYTAPQATTTVEVVEPEWATNEEARAAAEAVIKRQALEKRQSELVAQITELSDELDEVEKELGTY